MAKHRRKHRSRRRRSLSGLGAQIVPISPRLASESGPLTPKGGGPRRGIVGKLIVLGLVGGAYYYAYRWWKGRGGW